MQSLSPLNGARRPPEPGRARSTAIALATAAVLTGGISQIAAADCPWRVLPTTQEVALGGSEPPLYDIVFDGPSYRERVFYGFTVASLDLAWQLAERRLPELQPDGRRLEPRTGGDGFTSYQLAADTIKPHTIYLVAAGSRIPALEQIDARIEPMAPIEVSQLPVRGGGPFAGPLPPVVPGYEIAAAAQPAPAPIADAAEAAETRVADLQICAYEVAMR